MYVCPRNFYQFYEFPHNPPNVCVSFDFVFSFSSVFHTCLLLFLPSLFRIYFYLSFLHYFSYSSFRLCFHHDRQTRVEIKPTVSPNFRKQESLEGGTLEQNRPYKTYSYPHGPCMVPS